MTRRWLSRSIDALVVLTTLYVMHVIFFYGLSILQLMPFEVALPGWGHVALVGGSLVLPGLLWALCSTHQRWGEQAQHRESPPNQCDATLEPGIVMAGRWLSRSIDALAVLTTLYVMPIVLFYGLSVRQLVVFRATLAWWVHWTLWGGCFVLMGLFWLLTTVEQRRRKQTGRQRLHEAREPDEIPGHGSPTP